MRQTLYLLREDNGPADKVDSELPPRPPGNLFDVRFASDRLVERYEPRLDESQEFTLVVQSEDASLQYEVRVEDPAIRVLSIDAGDHKSVAVPSGNSLTTALPGNGRIHLRIESGRRGGGQQFRLDQNYPNPFNPATTVGYTLPGSSLVRLVLVDLLGREQTIVAGLMQGAGYHQHVIDAAHLGLASGVYFYRLDAIDAGSGHRYSDTRKLLFIQ